jgi:hypothetical protein
VPALGRLSIDLAILKTINLKRIKITAKIIEKLTV